MSKYDLAKAELVGTALIPWKECVEYGVRNSDLKQFNEVLYSRDCAHYKESDYLGFLIGRIGWIEYHQYYQINPEAPIPPNRSMFEYFKSAAPTKTDNDDKLNPYITHKAQVELPRR